MASTVARLAITAPQRHGDQPQRVDAPVSAPTGMPPLRWMLQRRVDRARELLESSDLSVEQIAQRSGLGSADSLRVHLARSTGLTPRDHRSAFKTRKQPSGTHVVGG